MREILFRGKRVDNGAWVEGAFYAYYNYKRTVVQILTDRTNCIPDAYEVIPETIGQYTGLTDKNGKKIFEGDIVKFCKYIYQIIFVCGSFTLFDKQGCMISKIGGMSDHFYSLMNLYLECQWEDDWAYDLEVIGNIHDNPELLKGI